MWGIIPAAGVGSRIQPLAFSKELLPLQDGSTERPRAVSDYLVERLRLGGATKICFVISPRKSDILEYYGSRVEGAHTCFVVQPRPAGLCDAVFQPAPLIGPDELVMVGLPDTVWFPVNGFQALDRSMLSFLLFPVEEPRHFDAVVMNDAGAVQEIQVKRPDASSHWIWGAFQMPGRVYHELHALWEQRGRADEFIGTLVNAYLARGGAANGVRAGTSYLDVGTLSGYRDALKALEVHA
ncbi:MAG: sugar phosphate nucleotidyltransferase [Acidobacteriota bacterium]|nr:sugar phosphate nucleotidyltransferase [Acidobacteriota bacterium]